MSQSWCVLSRVWTGRCLVFGATGHDCNCCVAALHVDCEDVDVCTLCLCVCLECRAKWPLINAIEKRF